MGSISKTQGNDDKVTRGQWLALAGLAVSAFIFNTSEFIPIGLLSDIGQTFSLTEAQTGIMISVYAWGVMVLSLPLMVFASRFDFRRLLLGLIAIFATGQFLSAISPTYLLLICSRLVVATAHAVFWSIVMVVAARVVSPRHSSTAMGIVATGSSIAQIFGMPLGRAIGLALGWRMTFAVVGLVAVASFVYLAVVFPPLSAGERFTLDKLPELFRNGPLVSLYVAIVFLATGQYVAYSYVEPFLSQTVALSAEGVTAALVVIGVAGLLGSYLFSRYVIPFETGYALLAVIAGEVVYMIIKALTLKRLRYAYVALFAVVSTIFFFSTDYVMNDVLEPHQQQRVRVLLGMEQDLNGAGYNVNQSKIAIGSGGLTGKGFLNGTQTKLKYVPEQDTDFIFCTVGEEKGFIGCAVVLVLYLTLILRLIYLSERQSFAFGRIFGYSVLCILLFHVFINIGMVIGLTPVIGIPLPFFSYGGSSLWGFTILLFVFLRIDAARKK